jgi:KaiC/GvpD/RAD55 family RecA-like ATPase
VVEHLGQLDFLHARDNLVLLGPPGTGKTHLAIAISIRACLAGQRVQFATATEWVARLGDAKRARRLEAELRRLGFIPLVVVDEVGYSSGAASWAIRTASSFESPCPGASRAASSCSTTLAESPRKPSLRTPSLWNGTSHRSVA